MDIHTAVPTYRLHHYPATLIEMWTLDGGQRLTLRPVLPQDGPLLAAMVERLSLTSRRNRFHAFIHLSTHHLEQMCSVDFRRQLALVVTIEGQDGECVIADARYCVDADGETAEFALVVDEQWRRRGVAARILRALVRAAWKAGIRRLRGEVLHSNEPMLALLHQFGFFLGPDLEQGLVVQALKDLGESDLEAHPIRHGMFAWLNLFRPHTAAS